MGTLPGETQRNKIFLTLQLLNCFSQTIQEAQLMMLTNPRDGMFYVNRVSACLVPFSR